MKISRRLRLNPIDITVIAIMVFGALGLLFNQQIFATMQWLTGTQAVQQIPTAPQPNDGFQPEIAQPAKIQAVEKPQDAPKVVETYQQPSQSAAPAVAPQQPAQGGHIPFTNDPVTSGDPQSYVGTVGQCPFYEMAGEKGCTPPPDIECNADWSICKSKGENQ